MTSQTEATMTCCICGAEGAQAGRADGTDTRNAYCEDCAETTAVHADDIAHGITFREWLDAAGRDDSASEYDLRAAWRAGEAPSEYVAGM